MHKLCAFIVKVPDEWIFDDDDDDDDDDDEDENDEGVEEIDDDDGNGDDGDDYDSVDDDDGEVPAVTSDVNIRKSTHRFSAHSNACPLIPPSTPQLPPPAASMPHQLLQIPGTTLQLLTMICCDMSAASASSSVMHLLLSSCTCRSFSRAALASCRAPNNPARSARRLVLSPSAATSCSRMRSSWHCSAAQRSFITCKDRQGRWNREVAVMRCSVGGAAAVQCQVTASW
jgi:hypothetical protein